MAARKVFLKVVGKVIVKAFEQAASLDVKVAVEMAAQMER